MSGRRTRFGPPQTVSTWPACITDATSDAAGNTYVVPAIRRTSRYNGPANGTDDAGEFDYATVAFGTG